MTDKCSSAATIAPLLPCPFCGNKPAIEDRDLAGKAKTIFCAEHDCIGPSTTAASYDDAAMQWNRRAGAAQQPAKPIGYAYEPEVQSSPRGYFIVKRTREAHYDVPVYAAQPPAAPVETTTKSAPGLCASHNSGERPPSSDAAEAGADTRCSAGTEPAGWLVDRPGDPTFPRFYRTEDEAKAMEAFITVSPRGNVRPVFTHAPQTAASPEISRLIAKSDEQTTALDQIMTTAADNLAAANSDLKMTLEFIHHVAEYTLAVTRPQGNTP
jgi:hypothetical protein